MKILSIGNSFSEDAQAYLHQLDETIHCVNLYIPGCSLAQHIENISSQAQAYDYQENGSSTGRKVSIEEALTESWNIVTLQQVSSESGLLESYFPDIEILSEFVAVHAATAKQFLHETWAYELDSDHPGFANYHRNQAEMAACIKVATQKVAERLELELIPTGDLIQELRSHSTFDYGHSGLSLCRDGYHLSLDYGRYAAAAIWLEKFTGNLKKATWSPEGTDPSVIEQINKTIFSLKTSK